MAYFHSMSVLHLDLNPENILITAEDKIKLRDPGVANLAEDVNTTRYCGTLKYAAPEVANGLYSFPADVYSFGLIMWELNNWTRLPDNIPSRTRLPDDIPSRTRTYVISHQHVPSVVKKCLADHQSRPSFKELVAMFSQDSQLLLDPQ